MPPTLFRSLHPQVPALPHVAKRALDLGCGDRPVFSDAQVAHQCIAADVHGFENGFPLVLCGGESLPFADASFDLVVSRVAIPYMHIPRALREIRRILEPGGYLWATLHLPSMAWRRIRNGARKLDVVDVVYQSYAIANCALLTVSSFQIPWLDGRLESVQTPGSISAALSRIGFTEIQTDISLDENGRRHFAVQARKT